MSGGKPNRLDHERRKCYGCGDLLRERAWLYRGTSMALCDHCHESSRRKEERDPVDLADLPWKANVDKVITDSFNDRRWQR